jgi:hypothetical protein
MAETVRIDKDAHAALAEIARSKSLTLTEALTRAIEALRREVFFEQMNRGYAQLREDTEAWGAENAERALWDRAVADGLEQEPSAPRSAEQTPASARAKRTRRAPKR